jgi:hypothetical protein
MKMMVFFIIKHSLFRYKCVLTVFTVQANALRIIAGIVMYVGRQEERTQIVE